MPLDDAQIDPSKVVVAGAPIAGAPTAPAPIPQPAAPGAPALNDAAIDPSKVVVAGAAAPINPSQVMSEPDYLAAHSPDELVKKGADAFQNGEASDPDQQKYQDAYAISMKRGGLYGSNILPPGQGGTAADPTAPVTTSPMLNSALQAIYKYTPNFVLNSGPVKMLGAMAKGTADLEGQAVTMFGGAMSDDEAENAENTQADQAAHNITRAAVATNLSLGEMATVNAASALSNPANFRTAMMAADPTGSLQYGAEALGAVAQHLFHLSNPNSVAQNLLYAEEYKARRNIELAKSGIEQGFGPGDKVDTNPAMVQSMENSPLLMLPMDVSALRGGRAALVKGDSMAARSLEFGPEPPPVPSIGQQTAQLLPQAVAATTRKAADVVGKYPILSGVAVGGATALAGHPVAGAVAALEVGKIIPTLSKISAAADGWAARIGANPATMGLLGRVATGTMQLAQDGVQAAVVSQLPNLPFIIGAGSPQSAAGMIVGGTMMHAAGSAAGTMVNGLNVGRSPWAPFSGTAPVREAVVTPGVDPVLDAAHTNVSKVLNNASNNFVQGIASVLKKAGGEGYVLFAPDYNAHMDSLVGKQILNEDGTTTTWTQAMADTAKQQRGMAYQIQGEDGVRTVAISKVTPGSPGIAFGHEFGHAMDMISDPETQAANHNAIYNYFSNNGKNPENVYDYKRFYDSMVTAGSDPAVTPDHPDNPNYPKNWESMNAAQQNSAVSELWAEHVGAYVNAFPLTAGMKGWEGVAKNISFAIAQGLEKMGAKQPQAVVKEFYDAVTTSQQSAAASAADPTNEALKTQAQKDAAAVHAITKRKNLTPTGVQPSATLGHIVENFLQAFKIDQRGVLKASGIKEPPPLEKPEGAAKPAEPAAPTTPPKPGDMAGAVPVEPPTQPVGFRKGDPIGFLKNPQTGMLMGTGATVVKPLGEGVLDENGAFTAQEGGERHYSVEYKHPDTGQTFRAPVPESWLTSSTGRPVPNTKPSDAVVGPKTNPGLPVQGTGEPPVLPGTPQAAHIRSSAAAQNAAFGKQATPEDLAHNIPLIKNIIANPTKPGAIEIIHNGAVTGPTEPDQIVRERERLLAGDTNRQANQKVIVPIKETPFQSEPGIFALDSSKILQNATILGNWLRENASRVALNPMFEGAANYLKSPGVNIDLQNYLQNQIHGVGGGGNEVVRPKDTLAGTIPARDPNYTPVKISDDKVQILNALMNYHVARSRVGAREIQNADFFRRMAEASGRKVENVGAGGKGTGPLAETNPFRAALTKAGFNTDVLNQATSQIRYRDIIGKAKPRPDLNVSAGSTGITKAGFMPSIPENDWYKEQRESGKPLVVGYVDDDGEIHMKTGRGEGFGHDEAFGGAHVDRPNFRFRSDLGRLWWWHEGPEERIMDAVVGHLESKGYKVKRQSLITPDDEDTSDWNRAHGVFMPQQPAENDNAKFIGHQEGFGDTPGFNVYNLKKDIPGHPTGSTVSEETLKKAGIPIPGLREQGNQNTRDVAAQYMKEAGRPFEPHTDYARVNPERAKALADFYEEAQHSPTDPAVKKAYNALTAETRAQWGAISKAGIKMEPFEGKGEPYKDSAAMMKDVRENKHLWFLPTEGNFSGLSGNPLMENSGVKVNGHELLNNDLFRAVHDYFGHTAEGYEFGPRGEYNAYLAHSRMFSEEAKPALAAETLAQNSWVNYGKHLRRSDGSIPERGDADFKPLAKRPFAEQKSVAIPQELLQHHFMPSTEEEDEHDNILENQRWEKLVPGLQYAGPDAPKYIAARRAMLAREAAEKVNKPNVRFMPPADPSKEHVDRAAVRYSNGKIATGDKYDGHAALEEREGTHDSERELGFISSNGRFLTRQEAFALARDAGQVTKKELKKFITPEEHPTYGGLEASGFGYTRKFMPPADPTREHVDRAAIRLDDGTVLSHEEDSGHGDILVAHKLVKSLNSDWDEAPPHYRGFISSTGKYLTRDEAFKLARKAGQVARKVTMGKDMMDASDLMGLRKFMPAPTQEEHSPTGWILPNGAYKGIPKDTSEKYANNGDWHQSHLDANRDLYNNQFGLKPNADRLEALKKGFVRVRYDGRRGDMGIEHVGPLTGSRLRKAEDVVEANLGKLDRLHVNQLNEHGAVVRSSSSGPLFALEGAGKSEAAREALRGNSSSKFMPDVPGYAAIAKHLTLEEREGMRASTAAAIVAHYRSFPTDAEYKTAAELGRAQKQWYADAASALRHVFGPDTERFVSLLAATSPRQTVQLNLHMAAGIWNAWEKAGRPTDEDAIRKIVEPRANLEARVNNSIRALKGAPIEAKLGKGEKGGELSGYKVEAFRKAVLGDPNAVVNDSWMAQFAGIPQTIFSSKAGQLAMNAKIRRAAEAAQMSPAEAQASIWSFFKTLTEQTKVDNPAAAVMAALTHEDIKATPAFATQLANDPRIKAFLAKRGVDADALRANSSPAGELTGSLIQAKAGGPKGVLKRITARAQAIKDAELAGATATRAHVKPVAAGENPF
jgi:hypothetical protein